MNLYLSGSSYVPKGDSGFVTYYLDYILKDRPGRQLWIQVRLNGMYTQPIPAVVDDFGNAVALV